MNSLTVYFNKHPISFSIAIAGAYLFVAVLGLSWQYALLPIFVGFFLGRIIDEG
jgi:hypothetical protein